MAKERDLSDKSKPKPIKSDDGLWVAPRYSLKGPNGERAWENRRGDAAGSSRYLELADIAMGLTKPEPIKKRSTASTHETDKTEPYSDPK